MHQGLKVEKDKSFQILSRCQDKKLNDCQTNFLSRTSALHASRFCVYIPLKALKQMFEIIGLPHAVLTVLPICYGMHCKYWSKYWPWVMIFNNWVLFWMCDIAGYIYWERRLHITNVWLNKQRLNWVDWFRPCKLETFVLGKSAQATCLVSK